MYFRFASEYLAATQSDPLAFLMSPAARRKRVAARLYRACGYARQR